MKVKRGKNRFGVWLLETRDNKANKRYGAKLSPVPVVDDYNYSKIISHIWSFEFWFHKWYLTFDLHRVFNK